jgi:hypothetical protein
MDVKANWSAEGMYLEASRYRFAFRNMYGVGLRSSQEHPWVSLIRCWIFDWQSPNEWDVARRRRLCATLGSIWWTRCNGISTVMCRHDSANVIRCHGDILQKIQHSVNKFSNGLANWFATHPRRRTRCPGVVLTVSSVTLRWKTWCQSKHPAGFTMKGRISLTHAVVDINVDPIRFVLDYLSGSNDPTLRPRSYLAQ